MRKLRTTKIKLLTQDHAIRKGQSLLWIISLPNIKFCALNSVRMLPPCLVYTLTGGFLTAQPEGAAPNVATQDVAASSHPKNTCM